MALVSYSGKNILTTCLAEGAEMRLLPGINEIEDAKLEKAKTHPLFVLRLQNEQVKIMGQVLGKDGKQTVDDMLKNIPKIFDTKLLKKIIENDGREVIILAAKNQLDLIKNPSKAKQEAASEHFG